MTTFAKRLPVFMLAGLMLVFILYGSGGQASPTFAALQATPDASATPDAVPTNSVSLPVDRPVVFGMLNNTRVDGEAGSYCWPQPSAAPQCEFKDDVQPTNAVNVANGDAILFGTDPDSPAPSGLHGTLLDDKNADGEPREVDLTATGGIFTVDNLSDGPHRLQVDALYPGTEQNQPFVAYVFLLQVGQTAAPTESVAETEVAAEPTDTMPEVNVTEVATDEGSAPTGTTPAPTEVAAETETPAVVAPTVEATAVATEAATQVAQPTVVPTTASVVEPTVIPTAAPTAVPVNVEPTTVPQQNSATGTTISASIPVPPATIIVSGRTYEPIAVNACSVNTAGETICINRPANSSQVRIFAAPGEAAQVAFNGPRPTAITLTVFSSDGTKVIGKVDIRPDNLILYNLPVAPGNYVISVDFTYPDGKASYFYRLAVSG